MFATQDNATVVLILLVGGVMLLLYGVRLMTEAMELALGARLRLTMMMLANRPWAAFVAGVLVTTLTQSSSATVTVLVGLVGAQSAPLAAAVSMQLGAGVGSTVLVQLLAFHITLGFNLMLAVIFVPVASQVSDLATKLLPDLAPKKEFSSRYLDPETLSSPSVALALMMQDLLLMSDLVAEMLHLSIQAFKQNGTELPKRIRSLGKKLNNLEAEIKHYLLQLDNNLLTEEHERHHISLLYVITELEAIGNIINKYLMQLVHRQRRKQIAFSQEEWDDIVTYHGEVLGLFQKALAGLAAQDTTLFAEVLSQKNWLNKFKGEIYLRHLYRMRSGDPSSLDTSNIHLELLNTLGRILSHTWSIARVLQGEL